MQTEIKNYYVHGYCKGLRLDSLGYVVGYCIPEMVTDGKEDYYILGYCIPKKGYSWTD
jgi:hypothetical protein